MGNYSEAWSFSDRNEQSAPAFSPDGKKLYFYQDGNLYIYDFRKRELKETIYNLEPEAGISLLGTTVAADEKNIYTWSHEEQIVAVYDLKGKYRKSYKLNQGDYSFSLSYANGMLWVSTDGNYETGTWYGYKLK
jgi:Tol biopolymer transport system component